VDEQFPINRISRYFPEGSDALLREFVHTSIAFAEGDDIPADPLNANSTPIERLVLLMVREAADEGAAQIRIERRPEGVAILYVHADGRVQVRDSPPLRLFGPLVGQIKLRSNDRMEFVVDDRINVGVLFDENEPCDGVTLTIRSEERRPSGA
jgi:hypothetical protein